MKSVHWPILRQMVAHPTRPLLIDEQRTWRNADLLVGAMALADEIEAKSTEGAVASMLPTGGMAAIAALAAWWLGRVYTPLNYLHAPGEIQRIAQHAGASTLITVGPMLDRIGWKPQGLRVLQLETLNLKGKCPSPRLPAFGRECDLSTLLYTSGTSGRSKGVMLTHGNLRANVQQVRKWIDLTPKDTFLGALPQFHSFGFTVLTLVPLTVGCKAVYLTRFSPARVLALLREHRPTFFVGIPSMYAALLRLKSATPDDFASLRCAVSGAEPLPQAVFESFRDRFGVTIHEGYGLTETAPATHWLRPSEFVRGSVGKPLVGVEHRIVDLETGAALPQGGTGEIRLRGPNVFAGYYKDAAQTAAVFDDDGFFKTGDIGWIDDQNRLYITGRAKEMLIVGGENVFPREIEEVLNQHPAVADSGVVGLPDDARGEIPIAFVELVDGATDAGEGELRNWCRDRLNAHRTPKRVVVLDALPRTPIGKVLRRALKEQLADLGR